ncbi:hypothetical protein CON11_13240 [Priestia megaterium]|nr:hypothetical protein CON11_13240 [Priestia megaterium]
MNFFKNKFQLSKSFTLIILENDFIFLLLKLYEKKILKSTKKLKKILSIFFHTVLTHKKNPIMLMIGFILFIW